MLSERQYSKYTYVASSNDMNAALIEAAFNGRVNNLDVLFNAGADINARGYNGLTPLHLATMRGHIEFVKEILARPGINLLHVLHERTAIFDNRDDFIIEQCYFLNPLAKTPQRLTAAELAVAAGHYEIELLLLKTEIAALQEWMSTQKWISTSKSITEADHTAVQTSVAAPTVANTFSDCQNSHTAQSDDNIHSKLIDAGCKLAARKYSKYAYVANSNDMNAALIEAAFNGWVNNLDVLFNAGADINARGYNGLTPLHLATMRGHIEFVKEILARPGINLNARTEIVDIRDDFIMDEGYFLDRNPLAKTPQCFTAAELAGSAGQYEIELLILKAKLAGLEKWMSTSKSILEVDKTHQPTPIALSTVRNTSSTATGQKPLVSLGSASMWISKLEKKTAINSTESNGQEDIDQTISSQPLYCSMMPS